MDDRRQYSDDLTIRHGRIDDATSVWPLVTEFAQSYVPNRESFEATFSRVIEDPDMLAVIAVDDRRISGYLLANCHETFFANGPVVWIEEVMVDDRLQRRGVGSALLRFAEEWADERGAAYVALATRRAPDFYTALGYEVSATFYRKQLAK